MKSLWKKITLAVFGWNWIIKWTNIKENFKKWEIQQPKINLSKYLDSLTKIEKQKS